MRSIALSLFIFICICFSSCGFVRNEEIIDGYHIVAVDDTEDLCLAYLPEGNNCICIVPEKILAYCKTEKYIFLKQSPYGRRDTINYYIVPILKDSPEIYPEESIIGPLKKQDFDVAISKRNIKNLNFEEID